MKRILKENITQEKLDNMVDFINQSMQVLIELEEHSKKDHVVTTGLSFRTFVCGVADFYYKNLKNE